MTEDDLKAFLKSHLSVQLLTDPYIGPRLALMLDEEVISEQWVSLADFTVYRDA